MSISSKDLSRTLVVLLAILQITVVMSLAVPTGVAEDDRPSPPSIFLMVAVQGDDILVTWTPVPTDDYGVYGLNLTRVTEEDWLDREVIAELEPETRSFLDQNVTPGVTYHYCLLVLSDIDRSGYVFWCSTEIGIRTDAVVPSAPYDLVATAGDAEVNLTWKAPLNDGGGTVYNYTVYMGGNASDLEPVMNIRCYDGYLYWACTVPNLTNGEVYFFAVRAINPVGASNLSEVVSARPMPSPRLTVVSQETSFGHFEISVSWTPPGIVSGNLTGYILYIDGLDTHTLAVERDLNNRSYFHELDPFGEMLVYRVAAVYDDGSVSYSNSVVLQFGMYEGVGFNVDGVLFVIAVALVFAASAVIAWKVRGKR